MVLTMLVVRMILNCVYNNIKMVKDQIIQKKRLPVKLVYYEEFQRIDEAFYREKQVQGWSRRKKEALIEGKFEKLPELSKNYTQLPSTSSGTSLSTSSGTDF